MPRVLRIAYTATVSSTPATAATYGMPLIVELGVFFDVLVAALIAGIYTNRLQDAFDSVDTSHLSELKE